MTEISEKEVLAFIGAFRDEEAGYTCWTDEVRGGLEAAARVRAEANAGEPVAFVCANIIPGTTDNELRAHLEEMVGAGERVA